MSPDPAEENFSLTVVHLAPRELVFAAMTSPEHLCRFWGPTGTTTPIDGIVVDLRPGGAFETTIVGDGGGRFTMRARYLAVEPPELLTWRELDTGMVTDVRFNDLGDGRTQVVTTQHGLPPDLRTPENRAGWSSALDRFAAYVVRLAGPTAGS